MIPDPLTPGPSPPEYRGRGEPDQVYGRGAQRVALEIAEFAAAHAGSELDLDPDFEIAALQAFGEDPR